MPRPYTQRQDFYRILSEMVSDPRDVRDVLDALEDVAHEASGEVEAAWQERAPGAPWRALAKIVGSARVKASKTLKRIGWP